MILQRPLLLYAFWGLVSLLVPSLVNEHIQSELAQIATPTTAFVFLPMLSVSSSEAPTTIQASATWSSPIAVTEGILWVVNPDAGTVSSISTAGFQKINEIAVGIEPWSVALAPKDGRVYVADRAAGTLVTIDASTQRVVTTTLIGPELGGLVVSSDGKRAYLSLMARAEVAVVDLTTSQVVAHIATSPVPYALAMRTDEAGHEQLYVTHLMGVPIAGTQEGTNQSRQGIVTVIDPTRAKAVDEIVLLPNSLGMPSMMESVAVSNRHAWIAHVRASPALPNSLTSVVFAAVSHIDLAQHQEVPDEILPLNDQEIFGSPVNNPAAVAPSPNGDRLYLVHGGSDVLEVVNVADPKKPKLVKFLPTGKNPRGITITPDGKLAFVMNYLSRSISVFDLDDLAFIGEFAVTEETLADEVLTGKILFHNATDPRLSRGGWISCASCHFEGWPDGITWFFPDGPRQTPMLWNAVETLPWHWSAALDEPQDVEDTIQTIQQGLGLAPDNDAPLLAAPYAGRSPDLDALAAFLRSGIRAPNPPMDTPEAVVPGRALFAAQGCPTCHGGPEWTSSRLPGVAGQLDADGNGMVDSVLRKVGTTNPLDIRGSLGIDPPSLLNVGHTAPYLHDGSMPTLAALLASGHSTPGGDSIHFTAVEVEQLDLFLKSIGPQSQFFPLEDEQNK